MIAAGCDTSVEQLSVQVFNQTNCNGVHNAASSLFAQDARKLALLLDCRWSANDFKKKVGPFDPSIKNAWCVESKLSNDIVPYRRRGCGCQCEYGWIPEIFDRGPQGEISGAKIVVPMGMQWASSTTNKLTPLRRSRSNALRFSICSGVT